MEKEEKQEKGEGSVELPESVFPTCNHCFRRCFNRSVLDCAETFNAAHVAGCFSNVYGIYLWTAGHRQHIEGQDWGWMLKVAANQPDGYHHDYIVLPANFHFWHHSTHQPDNANGREDCVNLWPQRQFMWNDEQCDQEMCFVCENRNSYMSR